MTKRLKVTLGLFFLLFAALSFLVYAFNNKFSIDGLVAPVNINIEIDKLYQGTVGVVAQPDERFFTLSTTDSTDNTLKQTIIHHEILNEYIQTLFIRVPEESSSDIINAVDNISIFIGNKCFYYPNSEIREWETLVNNGYKEYKIPLGIYAKSFIKPWINWYGDLNFALKEIIAFITNPLRFGITCFFLLCFYLLFAKSIYAAYNNLGITKKNRMELFLMIFLLIFAFLLRINAFTRFSSWADDLYSVTEASDPHSNFINTFKDPGNPPLFFVLLYFWFKVFGWSEASGRLLCVFIGLAGIISLYLFVKLLCGRKYAFVSAFLLTISACSIGYSNELRAYILQIALVSFTAYRFILLLKNQNAKNLVFYGISGGLLVNTHYFGVLFILGSFIFYFIYNFRNLTRRKILFFILTNTIMALSLIPYFAVTAFQQVTDTTFNTWIPKLGTPHFLILFLLPFLCFAYLFVRKHIQRLCLLTKDCILLLDYTLFTNCVIYVLAFLISLKKPILVWRYLSICWPLILAILSIFIFIIHRGAVKLGAKFILYSREYNISGVCILIVLIAFCNFASTFREFGGGYFDVYKESEQYIVEDAKHHAALSSQITNDKRYAMFYRLGAVPDYSETDKYEIVYLNPLHRDTEKMYQTLWAYKINTDNILKIGVNSGRYIGGNSGNIYIFKTILIDDI